MKVKSILKTLDSCLKSFEKGTDSFSNELKDFGDSMNKITTEFSEDVEKSKKNQKERESINKANLDKIWGKKDD
jgi:hypothetical protein